jgi:CheY-like chemotaxis protein
MRDQILLSAEDSDSDFLIIQMAIQQSGTGIHTYRVNNGEKALSFLHQSGEFHDAPRPDLVILDGNMPLKDGFQVLEHIKADGSLCSIPIVMLTSASSGQEKQKAMTLGAADFITKSSDLRSFVVNVQAILLKYLIPVAEMLA